MRVYDLIAKKRDGGTHSREELEAIVNGFVRGEVADYQMAAWMMAVYLCGRRRRVPQRPCLWRREARGSPPRLRPCYQGRCGAVRPVSGFVQDASRSLRCFGLLLFACWVRKF